MAKTDSERGELRRRRETPLITPTDLGAKASADIADQPYAMTDPIAERMRNVVDEVRDIATASLIENWIDETERRTWLLIESSRAS